MPDPDNPFRQDANSAAMAAPDPEPYHREAHGLTGEMLDAMLREQYTLGRRHGFAEAGELYRTRFDDVKAELWDEAHDSGARAGRDRAVMAALEEVQRWVPLLPSQLNELADSRGRQLGAERTEMLRQAAINFGRMRENIGLISEAE